MHRRTDTVHDERPCERGARGDRAALSSLFSLSFSLFIFPFLLSLSFLSSLLSLSLSLSLIRICENTRATSHPPCLPGEGSAKPSTGLYFGLESAVVSNGNSNSNSGRAGFSLPPNTVDQTCSQKCAELVRRFAHSWGLKQLYYESDRGYGWSRIGLY